MSYFKAKMHQIRFLLGLRPIDPAGPGAHSACPDPLTGFEGVLLLREGGGGVMRGREWKGRGRNGRKWETVEGQEERGKVASWLWGMDWTPLGARIWEMYSELLKQRCRPPTCSISVGQIHYGPTTQPFHKYRYDTFQNRIFERLLKPVIA